MRAFVFFLAAGAVFVVLAVLGLVSGAVPDPTRTGLCLVFIAYLTVGAKFAIADALSSDGFQVSKAAVDLSLTAFSVIVSLSAAQALHGTAIFTGPAKLLILESPESSPSYAQANLGAWLMSAFALALFALSFLCARMARQGSAVGVRARAKKLVAELACTLIGCFSCSSYLLMVYYKA